ncbi:P-loop NTPase fold protein [uncultured Tenacibaculum sp.]|uniref:KAP family P-loop NTPase fold protein n=1 Tax=uncultured Tenacibaculum sp. TaxID=174713 RepID=UPI00260BA82C|nr:P-loop NTPase fold protein [uncultured Tenacibaculum sp.]
MNLNDLPIEKNEDDLFNFKHYAKKIQKLIQNNSNNSEPLTIGIYGKWGEGKTSFLNLVEKQIDLGKKESKQKGILKYHFNPWRYSTEEEMLFDFFDGLSKMMYVDQDSDIQKIAKKITEYYKYIEAIKLKGRVGLVARILYSIAKCFKKKSLTLGKLIEAINNKLEKSSYKIAIFIDDIDRLDKNEIYTILKLIKLNANFNNFIYIIALDEDHVAKAISKRYGESIEDGKLFLEKIINLPIHLPRIEEEDLKEAFDRKLNKIVQMLGYQEEKKKEILELSEEFEASYFNNGREVVRVLNSFFTSAFAIGEEVNLRDLFWIEYLKICDSELYNYLKGLKVSSYGSGIYTIEDFFIVDKSTINTRGISKSLPDDHIMKNVLDKLFPYKDSFNHNQLNKDSNHIDLMSKSLKISSVEHYEKYFSFHIERKVSETKKKEIINLINSQETGKIKSELIHLKESFKNYEYRFYNMMDFFIKNVNEANREYFFSFLLEERDLITLDKNAYGVAHRTYFIELMGNKTKEENEVTSLTKKLSIDELFIFTSKIQDSREIKAKAELILIERLKDELDLKDISFIDYNLRKDMKQMFLFLYKKHSPDAYDSFISEIINNVSDIIQIIRLYTPLFDNDRYDQFNKSDLLLMSKVVDTDFLYEKLTEFNGGEINDTQNDVFTMENKEKGYLENETLGQFLFWYRKEKNWKDRRNI